MGDVGLGLGSEIFLAIEHANRFSEEPVHRVVSEPLRRGQLLLTGDRLVIQFANLAQVAAQVAGMADEFVHIGPMLPFGESIGIEGIRKVLIILCVNDVHRARGAGQQRLQAGGDSNTRQFAQSSVPSRWIIQVVVDRRIFMAQMMCCNAGVEGQGVFDVGFLISRIQRGLSEQQAGHFLPHRQ